MNARVTHAIRRTVAVWLSLATGLASAVEVAQVAEEVVERTNAFRNAQGLDVVTANRTLERAARDFARYMASTGKYGHAADDRTPAERAAAHGYDYCIVSENIAFQYRSAGYPSSAALAVEFVEGWKRSTGHRKNMLAPAVTQTGVGVARGDSGRYFAVQMFGLPKSAAIRFSVSNRSGGSVRYRISEREYSLPPLATRTHVTCRPDEITLLHGARPLPDVPARDGARYVVRDDTITETEE